MSGQEYIRIERRIERPREVAAHWPYFQFIRNTLEGTAPLDACAHTFIRVEFVSKSAQKPLRYSFTLTDSVSRKNVSVVTTFITRLKFCISV